MKKSIKAIFASIACVAALGSLVACGGSNAASSSSSSSDNGASGAISVVSREDGSGTRGAFVELTGVQDGDVDNTTSSAVITNSTAVMMTTVAGDPNAIGYISLGSLDDSVKAVAVDGVEPSVATVKDGSYSIQRPFNVITGKDDLTKQAQDYLDYIMSADGQKVIEDDGYVPVDDKAKAYKATKGLSGKVVVAGSSSVTPVMEKLAESYQKVNPDVKVEVQQSDSTTGVNSAVEGTCDLGMASRELKDSETSAGAKATIIAKDGVAVVVNNDNSIAQLTLDQIKAIFTGETTDWSALSK